jgi:prolyl-tRNA synthetase
MLWTQSYINTLKESPAEAEAISHKLMLRAGLIRKLTSGTYSYLPLGMKVLQKVETIIRSEMNAAGAQEVLLPALQPVELWKLSGRLEQIGQVMITFKDRHGKEMALGPTHEEVITDLVKKDVKSYRQLPVILYQIQTKFRDEPRPRFGIIRSAEFIMKDAYSFDRDEKGLNASYQKMYNAYQRIFERCGLKFLAIEAEPGIMGGDVSHEFTCPAESGEDLILECTKCNLQKIQALDENKAKANCTKCGQEFKATRAIEVGHTFKLKAKYSQILQAEFLDEDGREKPIVMGCYGIGVNRIIACAIEQNYDQEGIIWPLALAPYPVVIVPINIDEPKTKQVAFKIYEEIKKAAIDVLLDDRPERAGVKFKDADLLGFPYQVIVGEKNLTQDRIEIKNRKNQQVLQVGLNQALEKIKELNFLSSQ